MKSLIKKFTLASIPVFMLLLLLGCHIAGTEDVPGDIDAFDPINTLPEVSTFAGENACLVSISATGVNEKGLIKLEAITGDDEIMAASKGKVAAASVGYNFYLPVEDGWKQVVVGINEPHKEQNPYTGSARFEKPGKSLHKGMSRAEAHEAEQLEAASIETIKSAEAPIHFSKIYSYAIEAGMPEDDPNTALDFVHISYNLKSNTYEIKRLDFRLLIDPNGVVQDRNHDFRFE